MGIDIQAAADLLWHTWQRRGAIDALPASMRPVDRNEAYDIQAAFAAHSNLPIAGWKIAATSVAGQRHIDVSGPLAGRILGGNVYRDRATLSLAGNRIRVAEAEFVFGFAHPLPPRAQPYQVREVLDAASTLYLGIEYPDSRYENFVTAGETQLIADNACAHQFILGPAVDNAWKKSDLAAHPVHASVEGVERRYQRDGVGANVLGDPRIALTWLVNELSGLNITLLPGQFVTTGTCMVPLEIEVGDEVRVDYGRFGSMSCRFAA